MFLVGWLAGSAVQRSARSTTAATQYQSHTHTLWHKECQRGKAFIHTRKYMQVYTEASIAFKLPHPQMDGHKDDGVLPKKGCHSSWPVMAKHTYTAR